MCFVSLTFEISFLRLHRFLASILGQKLDVSQGRFQGNEKGVFTEIKFACYFPK